MVHIFTLLTFICNNYQAIHRNKVVDDINTDGVGKTFIPHSHGLLTALTTRLVGHWTFDHEKKKTSGDESCAAQH
jgi:hypothetical protein